MKKALITVLCALMLFTMPVSAINFNVGDTVGYVTGSYSLPVTENTSKPSEPVKYSHEIDMNILSDYIYGGSKATAPLMVKTTPDSDDYVKSGVYKINQTFSVVDATPKNGHYQIFYKNGLYYVETKYVNLQMLDTKKNLVTDIAEVNVGNGTAKILSDLTSNNVEAEAKNGSSIDVIQKDFANGYSKIQFNSKECYIKTEYLTNFQATPSASGLSKLGAPIGTLVIDSPYADNGLEIYSPSELEILKSTNYGNISDIDMMQKYIKLKDNVTKMWKSEWVNVYKIENFKSNIKDNPNFSQVVKGKLYTIVYDGMLHYVVQQDNKNKLIRISTAVPAYDDPSEPVG